MEIPEYFRNAFQPSERSRFVRICLVEFRYEFRGIPQVVYGLPGIFLSGSFISFLLNKVGELSTDPICPLTVENLLDFIFQVVSDKNRNWGRFQSEWERVRVVGFQ